MHGVGTNPDTEPVHTTELHGFVGKVLEIAGALVEQVEEKTDFLNISELDGFDSRRDRPARCL